MSDKLKEHCPIYVLRNTITGREAPLDDLIQTLASLMKGGGLSIEATIKLGEVLEKIEVPDFESTGGGGSVVVRGRDLSE